MSCAALWACTFTHANDRQASGSRQGIAATIQNANHHSQSMLFVPESGNWYQIFQWYFRVGAKFYLHRISPCPISHAPTPPPPSPPPALVDGPRFFLVPLKRAAGVYRPAFPGAPGARTGGPHPQSAAAVARDGRWASAAVPALHQQPQDLLHVPGPR